MNVRRMAKDAHRVFKHHPKWVYGVEWEGGSHRPSRHDLEKTILSCVRGLNYEDVIESATGRLMAQKDEDGYITVYLELGNDYDGV